MTYHIQDLEQAPVKVQVPQKMANILSSWATISFSKNLRSVNVINANVSMHSEQRIHTWCINQCYCMLYTWQMDMHLGKQWPLHYPHWGRVPRNDLCFSVWQKQVCTAALSSWSGMVSVRHICEVQLIPVGRASDYLCSDECFHVDWW